MEPFFILRQIIAARTSQSARQTWAAISHKEQLDWTAIARQAQRTGLAPLLHDSIEKLGIDEVPAAVAQTLRQTYLNTALRNTYALHELTAVLQALTSAHIPVIVLKGAALAQHNYGNIALRPMVDLDLLVPFKQLAAARQLVTAGGFKLLTILPFNDSSGLFWNEIMLTKPGVQTVQLELHWHLLDNPYYAQRLTWELLWQRAQPCLVEGVASHILSPEDQLLHLCAHSYFHHLGNLPQVGPDITQVLTMHPDLNWDQLIAYARAYHMETAVKETLTYAASEWGVALPAAVHTALAQLPSTRRERFFAYCQHNNNWKMVRTLLTLPTLTLRRRYLWGVLFPGRAYLASRYGVPAETPLWQAYLQRLGHIVKRPFQQ